MKLIVGLGNPGILYAASRHNIGFCALDKLAKEQGVAFKRNKDAFSFAGKGRIGLRDVILAKPFTFMNLSGIAVAGLVKHYGIKPQDLLVVCDDLDLDLGCIRIRARGSSAGQRGLSSVIEALGTVEFSRLRIGIGRPPHQLVHKKIEEANWCGGRPFSNTDTAEYVLSHFNKKEKEQINRILEKVVACCQAWVTEGIAKSMNMFNRKEKLE